MNQTHDAISKLRSRLQQSVIGQDTLIEKLLIALLASGNVLLEGFPGVAKTRTVKALGQALNASFARIQFTPDLLPSDVTGAEVYDSESLTNQATGRLRFQPGPLFNNLVLADEINRAPAKVQSALLEAMEEQQVTVAGKTYPMADLFMVLATQNPIEQEGTYPLPEAQLDRFLMKIKIDYPDQQAELGIIRLVRTEELSSDNSNLDVKVPDAKIVETIDQADIFEARKQINEVQVATAIEQYMVDLVLATRKPQAYSAELEHWIAIGCSPRASIALDRCARAQAWLCGRDYVTPEDVRAVTP